MCGKNTKCNIGQAGEEFQAVGAEKVLTLGGNYDILFLFGYEADLFAEDTRIFLRKSFSKAAKCGKLTNRTRRGAGSHKICWYSSVGRAADS